MSQFYKLVFKHIDKHFFCLILATLAFFMFKLIVDIFFTQNLIYILSEYFFEIKFEESLPVLSGSIFLIINYIPTLFLYALFGYFICTRLPINRVVEMVGIASLITFLLMLIVYTEHEVYIENHFLDILSLLYYVMPFVGLVLGVKLQKK